MANRVRFFTDRWVLLDDVVEVLALSQPHSARQYAFAFQRSDRSRVSWILIDIDDSRYWMIRRAKYLPQEPLRSSRIAFGCEQEVDGLACGVHGSISYAMLQDPPAQKLAPKELDAYVVRYTAGDLAYVLHRDGDRLIGQREGGSPVEWKAELQDVFFISGQPRIRRIFQRDTNGKITGFVDRRKSWDLVWKKTS